MSNGFYLTPAEQVDFLDDCKKDANGNMAYGERAAEIIAHAIQRAIEADDEPERTASGAELMRYGVRTELAENQNIRLSAGLYRISKI